ncbi:MAG: PDZ domain-containing protein [Candidatus Melainabacteria bacterium]
MGIVLSGAVSGILPGGNGWAETSTLQASARRSGVMPSVAPVAAPVLLPDTAARNDAFHAAAFRSGGTAQLQAFHTPGIVGVDLEITAGEYPLIMRVFPGTPAARAGLQAGDRLLGVNGRSFLNQARSTVDSLISDVPGTRLSFVVQPFASATRRQVALTVAAPTPDVAAGMGFSAGSADSGFQPVSFPAMASPDRLIYPSEW